MSHTNDVAQPPPAKAHHLQVVLRPRSTRGRSIRTPVGLARAPWQTQAFGAKKKVVMLKLPCAQAAVNSATFSYTMSVPLHHRVLDERTSRTREVCQHTQTPASLAPHRPLPTKHNLRRNLPTYPCFRPKRAGHIWRQCAVTLASPNQQTPMLAPASGPTSPARPGNKRWATAQLSERRMHPPMIFEWNAARKTLEVLLIVRNR